MGEKQAEGELILKLYELRRDEAMRGARAWYMVEFDPQTADDIVRLMRGGFRDSERYRMVTTYWEMAASLVSHGSIDEQLFYDSNTEHLAVYSKIEPFIAEVRAAFGLPGYLAQLERLATRAPGASDALPKFRALLKHWAERHRRGKEEQSDDGGK